MNSYLKVILRLSFVIGLALFAYIIWSIDRERTWAIISTANLALLAVGVMLTSFEAIFKSLKLRSLARSQSQCSFVDSLIVYLVGIPFGAVTPGKAGDFVKTYSLSHRTGIGLAEALAIGVIDRLADLLALIVFGMLGTAMLLITHTGNWAVAWLVAASMAIAAVGGLLLRKDLAARILRPVQGLLSQLSIPRDIMTRTFDAFYAGINLAGKARGSLARGMIFALIASIAISTRAFVFGTALGLRVAWIDFVLLVPIVTLIELLPISILGIGTREYAIIATFASLGVDREQAVSLSLSAFVFSLVPLAAVGYLVALKEHLRPMEIRPEP